MNAALRNRVRERARNRCEYCKLHEDDADYFGFHIEHVIAKQHGGGDLFDQLGLACAECNWAKGPNIAGRLAGKIYALFNPRTQSWKRHFFWQDASLVGKTKIGSVTVQVLDINRTSRVFLRRQLIAEGRIFPDD